MTDTIASDLKSLHLLHQRAKALRDRLDSGPKTLSTRQKSLEARLKLLEDARTALKQRKADILKREMTTQSARTRVDDLRVKLNAVRKNDEYKAITNQIATDNKSISKQEDEILELMSASETQAADLAKLEAEVHKAAEEFKKQRDEFEAKAQTLREQLSQVEAALVDSESIIPEDDRERYRRSIRGQGADAFAGVDRKHPACSGCFVTVTHQGVNELMIGNSLVFCLTCGRILYLED